ncbi:hypothetical protein GGI20_003076 [Coemansia sp. BCRC 34301]|nr:hypothetical protein GGI20_003076 [Coemansia sp. BCRC 34301]
MDINDTTTHEKLLDAASRPQWHQRQQQRRSLIEIAVKVVFGAIFAFLLVIVCMYAGSKTIFDTSGSSKADSGEKVLVEPKVRDCRSTGCLNEFECVPVAADFACFIPPCPSTVYECLPNAMLKDPEDALFTIQPISDAPSGPDAHTNDANVEYNRGSDVDGDITTDLYGEPIQLTEGYYACIQQHNGQRSWRHPMEPCNLCRCNPRGGVSCTKKLCKQGSQPDHHISKEQVETPTYASRILTTVMSLIDAEAGASGSSGATPRYTSIVVDIQH